MTKFNSLVEKSKYQALSNWISMVAIISVIIPLLAFIIYDAFRFYNYVDRLENKFLVVEMFSYPNTYVEFATFATLLGLLSILLQNRENKKIKEEKDELKNSSILFTSLLNQNGLGQEHAVLVMKELVEIKTILSEIKSDKVEIKTFQDPRKSKEQTSKDITLTIFSVAATLLFAKFYSKK